MTKGVQIAIAALTVSAAAAWVITTGANGEGTFRYYKQVSDFTSGASASANSGAARVHGFVVQGSIDKQMAAGHIDFRIADSEGSSDTLNVRLLKIDAPDLFRDGAEVVVEGRFHANLFLADRVHAKCPSKYENAPGNEV